MRWVDVFAVLVLSHLVGDYYVQTDWQARNKHCGLSESGTPRRALFSHVTTYTMSFVPALIWLADDVSAGRLVAAVALIFVPHLIQDDGRLLQTYMIRVKGFEPMSNPQVAAAVDQTGHLLMLFGIALLMTA
jgi:hypothetical protein